MASPPAGFSGRDRYFPSPKPHFSSQKIEFSREFCHKTSEFCHLSGKVCDLTRQFCHFSWEFCDLTSEFCRFSWEFCHLTREFSHFSWELNDQTPKRNRPSERKIGVSWRKTPLNRWFCRLDGRLRALLHEDELAGAGSAHLTAGHEAEAVADRPCQRETPK